MSDNPLFSRDFDSESFDPHNVSVLALAFWSRLRPSLFSDAQGALLLHSDEGAALLTRDFEPSTFELANQRVRTWVELQDLQLAPDFLRQLHRLQRAASEPDSPSLRQQAARAGFNGADYERWENLSARVAYLDEQLQLAQVRREWIECARDATGRAALRHFNSLLDGDSKSGGLVVKRTPTLEARIVLGLRQGFDGAVASFSQVREALHARLKNEIWTVAATSTEIIYGAGTEAGVEVALIDDPRFPLGESAFKARALSLAQWLLSEFKQQRLVLIFCNESLMIEAESPQ